MHTVWVRLNAVVFFGLTVLLSASILAGISKVGHANRPAGKPILSKLAINSLKSLKNHGGVDRALLSFDLHVDMNPAFHWNIKQLFVYIVATYATPTNPKNQIVLWDRILENNNDNNNNNKIIHETNTFVKYGLVDQGAELRGVQVELSLVWDHMPLTGALYMSSAAQKEEEGGEGGRSNFTLPMEYN